MAEVMVETSARHVHLSKEHIEILFGKGAELTKKRELSQPGQFACEERVNVVGEKKSIPNVIVLGPARAQTQVEVSLTDARTLGVAAPVRESGDLSGSGSCRRISYVKKNGYYYSLYQISYDRIFKRLQSRYPGTDFGRMMYNHRIRFQIDFYLCLLLVFLQYFQLYIFGFGYYKFWHTFL